MSGYWIYMLLMSLLIPLIMIGFGQRFSKKAPENINPFFGYRTRRSRMNKATWNFAHNYIGKLWLALGGFLFVATLFIMGMVYGEDSEIIGNTGSIVMLIQALVMVLSIFPAENALKRTFDENGKRREP